MFSNPHSGFNTDFFVAFLSKGDHKASSQRMTACSFHMRTGWGTNSKRTNLLVGGANCCNCSVSLLLIKSILYHTSSIIRFKFFSCSKIFGLSLLHAWSSLSIWQLGSLILCILIFHQSQGEKSQKTGNYFFPSHCLSLLW